MKVYLLGDYYQYDGGQEIAGIYSSLEDARKARQRLVDYIALQPYWGNKQRYLKTRLGAIAIQEHKVK